MFSADRNFLIKPALTLEEKEKLQVRQAALDAAYACDPHTYYLNWDGEVPEDARVLIFGCHGNGKKTQQQVADLINDLIKNMIQNGQEPPHFIIVLGDNMYVSGVSEPDSHLFQDRFYVQYGGLNIPCFIVLGNHDENRHSLQPVYGEEKGIARAMKQIAHAYFPFYNHPEWDKIPLEKKLEEVQNKQKFYNNENLNLAERPFPLWNSPSRFYSLVLNKLEIIILDSNTIVSETLPHKANTFQRINQLDWYEQRVADATENERRVIVAMHHPALLTPGTRAYHNDSSLYLSKKEREAGKKCFPEIKDQETYLSYLYEIFKAYPFTFLNAHDHNIYSYHNINLPNQCEIGAGAGGHTLQPRVNYGGQDKMGCFIGDYGLVMLKINTKNPTEAIRFSVFTIPTPSLPKGHHLEFTTDSHKPIRDGSKLNEIEVEQVNIFCDVVKAAVDEYFAFLGVRQDKSHGKFFSLTPSKGNLTHGKSGADRANHVWNYISQVEMDNLEVTIENVKELAGWKSILTLPTKHSFVTILDKYIQNYYGKGITLANLKQNLEKPDSDEEKIITLNITKGF